MILTTAFGLLPEKEVARVVDSLHFGAGMRSASTSELCGSTTLSSVPVTIQVGAVIASSTPAKVSPAAACACQPSRIRRIRDPTVVQLLDQLA